MTAQAASILATAREIVTRDIDLAKNYVGLRTAVESSIGASGLDPRDPVVHVDVTEAVLSTWIRTPEWAVTWESIVAPDAEAVTIRCELAERALVGAVLLRPALADIALPEVPIEDFQDPFCAALWTTFIEMRREELATDPITTLAYLRRCDRLAETGGGIFLSTCMDIALAPSFWADHARLVRDAGVHRRALLVAAEIHADATSSKTAGEVVSSAEAAVDTLGRSLSVGPITTAAAAVIAAMAPLENGTPCVSTGLSRLDDLLGGGMRPGNLIVLAGRPGSGKSALAGQIAVSTAWRGKAVCYVSLEMTAAELAERAALGDACVDSLDWKRRTIGAAQLDAVHAAAEALAKLPLFYLDSGTLTMANLRRHVLRLHAEQGGLALLAVDYLQLVSAGEALPRGRSREQEVAHTSRCLKALAKDLNIPVLALAQLNRQTEARTDKRPQLSDLRESGAIEQDADIVLLLYREDMYDKDSARAGIGEVIAAKYRGGGPGHVDLAWNGRLTRFANLACDEPPAPRPSDLHLVDL